VIAIHFAASCLHLDTYRILMARELGHKRLTETKTGKIARMAKKAKPKAASGFSHGNSASKAKARSKAIKSKDSMEKRKGTSFSARHQVKKERVIMEAVSRKSALRTGIASSVDSPPRLLHQTKTTSAALALLEKGIEYIFQRDFKKARGELKTLVETYPGEVDILARARSYMQICDREEAAQKKPAITSDQLYALGVLEHNRANYDKAVSYFFQSIENHPNADYIYYSVAASLAMKGDLLESIKNLRKAVELNEDSRIYAKNDSDFSALQTQKEFLELVGLNQSPAVELQ
jgi:tetratricopeptide (TPR) repeat protein